MSKTRSEVVTKIKDNVPPKSRTEIIDLLIDETNGQNSELGDSHILMYGGTEDTLRKQIESIITNNEKNHPEFKKFKTVEEFVDHAIRMQLIWWGKTPEIFNKELNQLIVTPTQSNFMKNFVNEQHKQFVDDLMLDVDVDVKDLDKTFDNLQTNIKKCYNEELEFDEPEEKNLMYDTYPVLWKYYSRLLPIKATLHIINYIAEKNETPYFELSKNNLNLAFHLLTKVGDILTEYDEVFSLKRNEKIGTGFPNNRKENDNEKRKITKMELVKSRFKSHLIGKKSTDAVFDKVKKHAEENQPNTNQELYEKFLKNNLEELVHNVNERHNISLKIDKQDWNNMKEEFDKSVKITKNKLKDSKGSFQGALNALDLVVPYYNEDVTKLYISSNGHKFLKIKNPVLANLKDLEQSIKQLKNASKKEKLQQKLDGKIDPENFSEEEVGFILEEIIPRKLNLEQNIIAEIISRLIDKNTLSATDVEELIAGVCLSWGYQNPEGFLTHKIDEHVANYFEYDIWSTSGKRVLTEMPEDIARGDEEKRKAWKTKKKEEITSLRMATMGRLSEMGIVEWKMKEGGSAEYSKGMHFDRVKHVKLMTRKEMIARRDDWKKFYKQD